MSAMYPTPRQSRYRFIADAIRGQIADGSYSPNEQLPATHKLAEIWQTSYCTVQNALQSLAKEGWIERLDGSGTFVSEFKSRFATAAVYHSTDIFVEKDLDFARALHTALVKNLRALDKECEIFIDSRPPDAQHDPLPSLMDAIRLRRVQCVIAPTINKFDAEALARLRLPTAFPLNGCSGNQVFFNMKSLLSDGILALKNQGCRSFGIISHIGPGDAGESETDFYGLFQSSAREHGVITKPEWIRSSLNGTNQMERHGYREFKALYQLPDRPDGLVVYPDMVGRGVIMAGLELGLRDVSDRMKFLLHRNAHVEELCPFAATWAVADVGLVATEMIGLIQRQFDGVKTKSVLLDHVFESVGPQV